MIAYFIFQNFIIKNKNCKNEIEKAKKLYSEKIEDFKKQCESEKSEVISKYEKMISEEEEIIKSKSDKIIDEYRAELDEEHQNLQKDMDTQLKEKKKINKMLIESTSDNLKPIVTSVN